MHNVIAGLYNMRPVVVTRMPHSDGVNTLIRTLQLITRSAGRGFFYLFPAAMQRGVGHLPGLLAPLRSAL